MITTSADHGTPIAYTPEQIENVKRNTRREIVRLRLIEDPIAALEILDMRHAKLGPIERANAVLDGATNAEIDALYASYADQEAK